VDKNPDDSWPNYILESNSWGAENWRVVMIRKGQLEVFFQNPHQGFTMNYPDFNEIPGGAHIEQKLNLNGGNWCGFGHCSPWSERGFAGRKASFEPGDLVVVTYDVPFTTEASKMGVWYGVAGALTTVL
jgi:hypothetical protein